MLALDLHQVHVWQQSLVVQPMQLSRFQALLSADEQQRAARFCRDLSRQQYVVSRGSLRLLLSRYLMIEPQQIRFGYGPQGKPFLVNDTPAPIRFNLSHSGQLVMIAIARDRNVGVDLEQIRATLDIASLSENCFSEHECQLLASCSIDKRATAFFQLWTCKEALLKAAGTGINNLENTKILALPEVPFEQVPFTQLSSRRLSLQLLPTTPGYIAALAVEGYNHRQETSA